MPISKNRENKDLVIGFYAAQYNLSEGATKLLNYIWDLKVNEFPSEKKISEDLGCARQTLNRWRRELEGSGIFDSDDQPKGPPKKE